jgi:hypothetical protein
MHLVVAMQACSIMSWYQWYCSLFTKYWWRQSKGSTGIVEWLNCYCTSVIALAYLPHRLIRPSSTEDQSIQSGLQTIQTAIEIADHQDSHCDCYYGNDPNLMHQLGINSSKQYVWSIWYWSMLISMPTITLQLIGLQIYLWSLHLAGCSCDTFNTW